MSLSKHEEKILKSIIVPSENDPNNPEFPPDNPKFPATPTYKIEVPKFSNVWLKDESVNPTGTHKDRMVWEMVVTYRDFLLAKFLYWDGCSHFLAIIRQLKGRVRESEINPNKIDFCFGKRNIRL